MGNACDTHKKLQLVYSRPPEQWLQNSVVTEFSALITHRGRTSQGLIWIDDFNSDDGKQLVRYWKAKDKHNNNTYVHYQRTHPNVGGYLFGEIRRIPAEEFETYYKAYHEQSIILIKMITEKYNESQFYVVDELFRP